MVRAVATLRLLGVHARLVRVAQLPQWRARIEQARATATAGADPYHGAATSPDDHVHASPAASAMGAGGGAPGSRAAGVSADVCRDVVTDLELIVQAGRATDDWAGARQTAAGLGACGRSHTALGASVSD
jgi:hypothetical protein